MKIKLIILALAFVTLGTGALVSAIDQPQQKASEVSTQQESVAEPVVAEEAKPVVETSVSKPTVVSNHASTVAEQPNVSVCDPKYGSEIAPGVCQMDLVLFNTFARTVTPEGSKLFKVLQQANNRIYKTSDQSIYMPFCKLPNDLRGGSGDLVGEYPAQLRLCANMVIKAQDPNSTIYATAWAESMRSIYNAN